MASTLFAAMTASAQQLAPPVKEIALYSGVAPGSENWTWTERSAKSATGTPMAQNVVRPVLLYYPADKATAVGTTMIVAPGGGFRNLMMSYEGVDIARRLNEMGIDAFVLKYRLDYSGSGDAPDPKEAKRGRELGSADGRQAVRLLRSRAAEFNLRPDRIGMIGFSAGGAVVLSAVTATPDARPNFAVPIYAADAGSTLPPADGAPPLFIAVSSDDQAVGFQGSIDLFSAWRKANVPVELHVFQTGQHGFVKKGGGADHFMDRLEEWLKVNGFLTKAGS
jgi:acetyl esterase/lipase